MYTNLKFNLKKNINIPGSSVYPTNNCKRWLYFSRCPCGNNSHANGFLYRYKKYFFVTDPLFRQFMLVAWRQILRHFAQIVERHMSRGYLEICRLINRAAPDRDLTGYPASIFARYPSSLCSGYPASLCSGYPVSIFDWYRISGRLIFRPVYFPDTRPVNLPDTRPVYFPDIRPVYFPDIRLLYLPDNRPNTLILL